MNRTDTPTLGILGTGMLGSAIARGLLDAGACEDSTLVLCNRSGTCPALADRPGLAITTDPADLCARCNTLLLCLPPAATATLVLPAADHLVLSVMAGVTLKRLGGITGSARLVRAMSSPAAALGLAYGPWIATPDCTAADRDRTRGLFAAIGETDEIGQESLIDQFTAMTGPVPGFVAFFADAMIRHAESAGAPPEVALRAVRQLFLAGGRMMAEDETTPAEHLRGMIDYAGTTAAGLTLLAGGNTREEISRALDAAADRCRTIV
ncbi:pyrroline-5-carboxylate reductase family protein [Salipiger sp.]|uniref:pyrroline-5-carboxylate reductase family protein n=1 Tax=Salipiger sp. TaxID=2078585 RepID=UPI003A978C69